MAMYYLYREVDKYLIPLGDVSFNKFYPEDGWYVFDAMVKNNDPSLNNFVVRRDDKKEALTFEEFLAEIERCDVLI